MTKVGRRLIRRGTLRSLVCGTLALSSACGGSNETPAPRDDTEQPPPRDDQDLGIPCDYDSDCDNGAFCDGRERCFEGSCYAADSPSCDDGIDCTTDTCSHLANNCVFTAPDEDGDGHAAASCEGPDGESLGDDCADDDPTRYPGASEVCDPADPGHDEDCDPTTFGYMDADLDGVIWDACCNDDDGEQNCGTDCDDDDFRKHPMYPEICDDIDNDCDGEVDVNARVVSWYPDEDGDNFGVSIGSPVMSCAPIEGHSLSSSDCDDGTAAVHSAALETCDEYDNDCDGDVDEDNVCACAPDGNVRPCACSGTRTGTQGCSGGLWTTCDCDECVTGDRDCVAGILPRECKDGKWEFLLACQGHYSECNDGECTCPGGGFDCGAPGSGGMGTGGGATTGAGGAAGSGGAVVGAGGVGSAGSPGSGGASDDGPPQLISTIPVDLLTPISINAAPGAVFDRSIDPGSAEESVALTDIHGVNVPGAVDTNSETVTFTPNDPLTPGTYYSLSFSTALQSEGGVNFEIPIQFMFATATDVMNTALSPDSNLALTDVRIQTSPQGHTALIAREKTVLPFAEQAVALDFDGLSFGEPVQVSAAWPAGGYSFGVDDAGRIMATAIAGGTLARHDRQSSVWSSTSISVGGDPFGLAPVAVNGAGRGFIIYEDDSAQMTLWPRATTGSYETAVAATSPVGGTFDVAINEAGVGAYATNIAGDLAVLFTDVDLASPVEDLGLDSSLWSQSVAVGADDKIYVAYSKNFGVTTPPDQVQLLIYDNTWGGPIDIVGAAAGGGDEFNPDVGVNAGGDVFVAYTKNQILMVSRMASGQPSFTPPVQVSLPGGGVIDKFKLLVGAGGAPLMLFTQEVGGTVSLWATRYVGAMWGRPHMMENFVGNILDFDGAIDDSGNAIAVLELMVGAERDAFYLLVP